MIQGGGPEPRAAARVVGGTRRRGLLMLSAVEIRRTAREAGLLYLAMSVFAMIGFYYLPTRFIVTGDAAATARNIVAGEPLYRTSLLLDLVAMLLFIPVAL